MLLYININRRKDALSPNPLTERLSIDSPNAIACVNIKFCRDGASNGEDDEQWDIRILTCRDGLVPLRSSEEEKK